MPTASAKIDSLTPTMSAQETSAVTGACERLTQVRLAISHVLVGQEGIVEGLLIGLLTGGHVLLEGVPGLAKTTAVKALAGAIDASFRRVQFTPDLLPSDITGNLIYSPASGEFRTKLGPIFANLVLADEINRAPAKVQSALLEAMQEHQVTLGDQTHALPQPFLVMATENPIEQEGTYPLPEAQVDRFMLKVLVTYPTLKEERLILDRMARSTPDLTVSASMDVPQVLELRTMVDAIHVADEVKDYIVRLVDATRGGDAMPATLKGLIRYGASPRATINLTQAARAHALLRGRGYASPEDVKAIAPAVLRHRVITTFEAEAEGIDAEAIVQRLLDGVRVP
jgi:MoxR-like ATPase